MAARASVVGIDLAAGEESEAIVASLLDKNPQLRVRRMPGLVRVESSDPIEIDPPAVAQRLGREWEANDFNLSVVSYFGEITAWDDDGIKIEWPNRS